MNEWEIAERGLILRGVVGSNAHGLVLDGQDDRDEMGICIEPLEYVVGLRHFEQYVSRTKPVGVRSGPGDLDLVIYSLRKWVRLALKGNPTILILLHLPAQFLSFNSEAGRELRSLAPEFAARSVAQPFLGYLRAQRQRLAGERGGMKVNRPELVEAHGFDTKYAGHVLRLGYQGCEFLETGAITLPMPDEQRREVMKCRTGGMDLSAVLTKAGELEKRIEDLAFTSPLPGRPNVDAVERWMMSAYMEAWGWRKF